jgi:hypothetical protein
MHRFDGRTASAGSTYYPHCALINNRLTEDASASIVRADKEQFHIAPIPGERAFPRGAFNWSL